MSRCFPFPPPGYEKKSRAEDADLLKKEKSKEKKHKKEKKEKEKKEGKEKRDKDKSDEKRREKKDKKKDRDKKKERDKEKEKEKAPHALEESKPSGKIKSQNGEEVVRIKHNSIQEEKHSGKLDSYVGNKIISQNTVLPKETKNSKLVPEVGRRIEDSATAKVEKLAVAQPKRDDGVATQVARSSEILFEGNKEHIKNKTIDQGKYNGQGIRHDERFSGDSTVPSFTATTTTTANATVESVEKSAERRKETNDKIRPKEGEEKRGSKHKDKDKERKGRSNDKEKKKEKKAKAKAKEKKAKQKEEEEKNAVVDKTKEITKDNLIGRHSTNTNTSQLPDSNIGAAVEENLIKKRKAFEPNGVLHAIDNRSSKLLRPASHPLKENGRILEPCLASPLPPSERQTVAAMPPSERQTVAANDVILVSKERKINGIIEAHHPPASLKQKTGGQDDHPQPRLQPQPQPTAIHKKSPHPDSKFLSVVYSVPKMEELSDSDNQDWLVTSNTSQAMKPELEASEAKEMPQVWAEAMQIEPPDVYALPYVIPY